MEKYFSSLRRIFKNLDVFVKASWVLYVSPITNKVLLFFIIVVITFHSYSFLNIIFILFFFFSSTILSFSHLFNIINVLFVFCLFYLLIHIVIGNLLLFYHKYLFHSTSKLKHTDHLFIHYHLSLFLGYYIISFSSCITINVGKLFGFLQLWHLIIKSLLWIWVFNVQIENFAG